MPASGGFESFTFPGIATRVLFGSGRIAEAAPEIERLGRSRALIVTTSGRSARAEVLAGSIGPLAVGIFAGAAMHTPVDVTEAALVVFRDAGADCVVALGGGSAIGLGKAIATRTGADQIVIPTTYAGSEMTDILGETAGGEKVTRRDPSIRPEVVIYDVDLTLTLPASISVVSGLNALAHAAEGLYAPDRTPKIPLAAAEAARALIAALPAIVREPSDPAARTLALRGAWLASVVLGGAAMSLHHKLCHVLGGGFGLPHAETHAVMLPHTIGFNAAAARDALAPLAAALDAPPGPGLYDLGRSLGAPMSLASLGMAEDALDRAADAAVRSPYANPRPFDRADIRGLLQSAWTGVRPLA
jgi:maleylacetate reductase